MSTEQESFHLGSDIHERLIEFAEDRGITKHKAGIRAIDRGLHALGYSDIAVETTRIGRIAGEAGKMLVAFGLAFFLAAAVEPAGTSLVQVLAAVSMACAIVAFMLERAEPELSARLGIPDEKRLDQPETVADEQR